MTIGTQLNCVQFIPSSVPPFSISIFRPSPPPSHPCSFPPLLLPSLACSPSLHPLLPPSLPPSFPPSRPPSLPSFPPSLPPSFAPFFGERLGELLQIASISRSHSEVEPIERETASHPLGEVPSNLHYPVNKDTGSQIKAFPTFTPDRLQSVHSHQRCP